VEEHKEVERDLGRHSGRAGVVGGGPATELCSGWRRQVVAVVSSGEGVGELQCAVGKLAAGSIGAEEGRGRVLHGEQGAAAAMACGGASGARAGARPGPRRSGTGAGQGKVAWNAKNHSGMAEDGRRLGLDVRALRRRALRRLTALFEVERRREAECGRERRIRWQVAHWLK
jgi:hypothetical protein